MALVTGSRLGPYEILAPIGAGGMGEVYRARDAKLGRDVALKVLPEAFARDADRMARFQREAKVLASLNHPNIASIYGLEDSGVTHALVMELVEGPTLADRIKSGPIPIDEALRIAKQITEALEYAHERGIVHRDLKPANVKVTNDDAVKVLDFGLAKAIEGDAASIDIATSPTMSRMATLAGVLLGTAAYMSPEQAKAKPVDRRADIWAFGCVLYEMLTSKMTFSGETVTDTLAAVIMKDPDWSQLPGATPIRVRVLLQRCLQKDSKQRLRDIGDARISLDEVLSGAPDSSLAAAARVPAPLWRRTLPWALFGATAVALTIFAWAYQRTTISPPPAQVLRYQILPPGKTSFGPYSAISPDGRHLAFTAAAQDGRTLLWVRDLDRLEARPLAGTEGAANPFWSADSRALGFASGTKLEKVDIWGGAPQVICDAIAVLGAAWNRDGVIIFGSYQGVMKVSAAGGTPSPLTAVDSSRGELLNAVPSFLPDGQHFLYSRGPGPSDGTYVGSVDARPDQQNGKRLLGPGAVYASASGHEPARVLFLQGGTLMAQRFDADRLEPRGDPAPVAQDVASFTVSSNGMLAYASGRRLLQLTWFDRQGKVLGTIGGPDAEPRPAVSPDGNSVVVGRQDPENGGEDLWLYNVARGTSSRFTFDGNSNQYPTWSPDSSHIAFVSLRDGNKVKVKAVNGIGDEETIDSSPANVKVPLDWSSDGRYIAEGVLLSSKAAQAAIWLLPLSPEQAGGDRKPFPYLDESFNEIGAKLSPNGQWIAYISDETKRYEIFAQTFPTRGGKWQVSTNGGTRPVWSRDGKELYFIGADGKLMAVDVRSGPGGTFESGAPRALFDPRIGGDQFDGFDVSKDGRFLIPAVVEQSGTPITIVANWTAGLNK
jgi:eukaryotic-like serine/threonine-protein kinase